MTSIIQIMNSTVTGMCHILALVVITIGIGKAMTIFIKDALLGGKAGPAIQESRLELGHSFSLGLGFLIGASILRTTLAPSWNDLGQLATIIGIRTALNYFLMKEISRFSRMVPEESALQQGFPRLDQSELQTAASFKQHLVSENDPEKIQRCA
jgi:uncharacterized membrane protein